MIKLLIKSRFLLILVPLLAAEICFCQQNQLMHLPDNYLDYGKCFMNTLDSTKIFALGEFTHGGSQTFNVKSSLVKYLVKKQNFRILFIEFDDPSLRQIDHFLRDDKAFEQTDLDTLFYKSFMNTPLCCQEFKDLIVWIKKNNLANTDKQVQIKGIDIILDFSYFIDNYFTKDEFLKIKKENSKGSLDIVQQYQVLLKWFKENKEGLKQRFPIIKHTQLLQDMQNFHAHANFWKGGGSASRSMVKLRDSVMSLNVITDASQKAIIWAQNSHVVRSGISYNLFFAKNLGSFLNDHYKSDYSCLITEFSGSATVNVDVNDKFSVKKFSSDKHSIGYSLRNQIEGTGFVETKKITFSDLSSNNVTLEGRKLLLQSDSKSFDYLVLFPDVTPSNLLP